MGCRTFALRCSIGRNADPNANSFLGAVHVRWRNINHVVAAKSIFTLSITCNFNGLFSDPSISGY
jgi:hypothetical protein